MKRNRIIVIALALAVLLGSLPALAEGAPEWLPGSSWKLTTLKFICSREGHTHSLDPSATIHLYEGYGTHLTFNPDSTLDTDIDLPRVIEACPTVPFDLPALSIGGDSWVFSGETLTFLPSLYEYEVEHEDGALTLIYRGKTLAHADGNPDHFTDGPAALQIYIGLEPAEEPAPEPTEEPTPEPTEEPAPEADLSAYGPGLDRSPTNHGYDTAQHMAEKYGIDLTDGAPLYTPAHPQPLNAYIVTREDCDVGINYDDMYKVADKGLVDSITKYLVEWSDEIASESNRAIRFVIDPDDADVLIVACQTFEYYGLYGSGAYTCSAYSSRVTLKAVQLTNPQNTCEFSAVNEPGSTITTNGGSKFWKHPPEIEDTQNLTNLAEGILSWYGCDAKNGSKGAGVKAAQQALIDRGFLEGGADGSFGPKTEAAVKRLQQAYGLEETGVIDRKTTVALYFNDAAVESMY